jgi:hypothetical protein
MPQKKGKLQAKKVKVKMTPRRSAKNTSGSIASAMMPSSKKASSLATMIKAGYCKGDFAYMRMLIEPRTAALVAPPYMEMQDSILLRSRSTFTRNLSTIADLDLGRIPVLYLYPGGFQEYSYNGISGSDREISYFLGAVNKIGFGGRNGYIADQLSSVLPLALSDPFSKVRCAAATVTMTVSSPSTAAPGVIYMSNHAPQRSFIYDQGGVNTQTVLSYADADLTKMRTESLGHDTVHRVVWTPDVHSQDFIAGSDDLVTVQNTDQRTKSTSGFDRGVKICFDGYSNNTSVTFDIDFVWEWIPPTATETGAPQLTIAPHQKCCNHTAVDLASAIPAEVGMDSFGDFVRKFKMALDWAIEKAPTAVNVATSLAGIAGLLL